MSTPQGPDRYGADRDPDLGGPPTWGTPPPGGWGSDPDAGPPTGAWDPAADDYDDRAAGRGHDQPYGDPAPAYGGRRRAEDRHDGDGWGAPADAPWGDQYGERYTDQYGNAPQHGAYAAPDDPWNDPDRTAAWGAEPQAGFASGDEPWAPRAESRGPRRGPFGLGRGALAGIGVGAVLVIALLVGLFVYPGWAVARTLDKTALQNGVTQILTQDYGLQVGAVECPDDVKVAPDTGFACQALIDGEPVTVPGKVTTDEGDYQVSRV
ncbi:DUF4333 domain-containing protein [Pseudonocardia endophytica]|uniref:Uncharacterized protein DUF4333 n=1 Tax=Pseudonocardia endophytica TaxID=401976 RepID=A0A4R1HM48_PSEEN|nr:DUF4333 domain-containing protein [Pseudonocardia endophytica]TCK23068.1 uncharacterized protein DUF4333 [Pseudonocardia endophytica]